MTPTIRGVDGCTTVLPAIGPPVVDKAVAASILCLGHPVGFDVGEAAVYWRIVAFITYM